MERFRRASPFSVRWPLSIGVWIKMFRRTISFASGKICLRLKAGLPTVTFWRRFLRFVNFKNPRRSFAASQWHVKVGSDSQYVSMITQCQNVLGCSCVARYLLVL